MNGLGLDAAALETRRRYVCAGDAARIMAGNWRDVWLEKAGRAAEPDLSGELRVQMGLLTEPFNLAWCERQTGRVVEYYSGSPLMRAIWETLTGRDAFAEELQVSRAHPFMACNLDAMTVTARGERCVLDAKHVGRADDPMILRYTAAGTHQATVMGTDWWALSVLVGNGKWELIEQEVDPLYQAALIAKEREFWGYVERDEEPPDDKPAALPPAPQPKLRTVVIEGGDVDPETGIWTPPTGDKFQPWPNWGADFARDLATVIRTQPAATANAIARDAIKKLVPEDVGEIRRGDVAVKRDKAGALRFTLPKGDDR